MKVLFYCVLMLVFALKSFAFNYMQILPHDYVLGNKGSGKYIIVYSSLTCPHCASFYTDIFPKIQADLIDTGKIAFINRSFISDRVSLAGTMLSYCNGEQDYYKINNVLFKNTNSWVKMDGYLEALEKIAGLASIDKDKFYKCMDNHQLQDQLMTRQKDASEKLKIKHIPYIIVNGKEYSGAHEYKDIKSAVLKD